MHLLRVLARSAALATSLALPAGPGLAADGLETAGTGMALALGADGALTVTGALPHGLSPDDVAAALPGSDVSGIDRTAPATAAPWQAEPALEALSIVLPRFRTATAWLGQNSLAVEGTLNSGLSAAGVEAALRAALGTGWRLDLRVTESAPVAEVVIARTDEGLVVRGLLPKGLDPAEALTLLGQPAGDGGLASGGESDAPDWSAALSALGETLDFFAAATTRVTPGQLAIGGVLRPGYPRDAVAGRLVARLPPGWSARLDAIETPPDEGDRRVSIETGLPESFRRGYWLPDVGFPVSAERCRVETEAALGREDLPFVDGEAALEARGLPLLNRLAAIAVRCLNSSSLRLEIAGHTDSVGNDARNEALSRARADAVRQALLDRGVRVEAVTAEGHGESRPVATNNTPEGRARNRRIVFEWVDPQS